MRTLNVLALFVILALTVLAVLIIPGHLGQLVVLPGDPTQHELTCSLARQTVEKFETRHGGMPVEQWPELDRQTYRNARRILAEAGELMP